MAGLRPRRPGVGRRRGPDADIPNLKKGPFSTDEPPNKVEEITGYNNFYEFGIDKERSGPLCRQAEDAGPGPSRSTGEVAKPGDYAIDDLIKMFPLEERIYRLRCVEAWSMVIPWVGFPLGDFLKRVEPTSKAKYVAFTTLLRPGQMPGQRSDALQLAVRRRPAARRGHASADAAAVGLYGKTLPNQNGAPIRLVVPWKYGFKSIKSIVRIRLVEKQPPTAWNIANAERIRLLLQRESRGRSSALDARPASAASASSSGGRR